MAFSQFRRWKHKQATKKGRDQEEIDVDRDKNRRTARRDIEKTAVGRAKREGGWQTATGGGQAG